MALVECERGHVYDDEKFPVCPYCMNSRKQKGIYISVAKKEKKAKILYRRMAGSDRRQRERKGFSDLCRKEQD